MPSSIGEFVTNASGVGERSQLAWVRLELVHDSCHPAVLQTVARVVNVATHPRHQPSVRRGWELRVTTVHPAYPARCNTGALRQVRATVTTQSGIDRVCSTAFLRSIAKGQLLSMLQGRGSSATDEGCNKCKGHGISFFLF